MTGAGCNQTPCDCKANAGSIMPKRQAEFTRFRHCPLTPASQAKVAHHVARAQ